MSRRALKDARRSLLAERFISAHGASNTPSADYFLQQARASLLAAREHVARAEACEAGSTQALHVEMTRLLGSLALLRGGRR